jgi:hypothetical protein
MSCLYSKGVKMMSRNFKLLVLILIFIIFHGVSFAQDPTPDDWVNSGSDSITTTKNVGIGTTTPEYGLHLGNNNEPKSLIFTIDNPTQSGIIWKYIGQAKTNAKISSVGNGPYANKGLAFYTTDSQDTTTNAIERMRITESGNVGIGAATPGALLDIYKVDSALPATLRVRSKDTELGTPPFSAIELRSSSTTDFSADFPAGKIIAGYDNATYNSARLTLQSVNTAGSYIDTLSIKNGNVGVGILTPQTPIHAFKQNTVSRTSITDIISLDSEAYGVGGPGYDGFGTGLVFRGPTYQNATIRPLSRIASIQRGDSIRDYGNAIVFQTIPTSSGSDAPIERMRIEYNGNVGIGTTNPGTTYKLAVEGKIGAREVVVTQAAWADHVFQEDYNLPTLDKVESYIKENKHLPDVPSAKEVEEEGLSMSQMMAKQMQKIEELTLYVIEQNKKLESQNNEISVLKKELAEMQKNMN